MVDLNELNEVGVAPNWKSRQALIKALRTYVPSTMDRVIAYNSRTDHKNKNNVVQSTAYQLRGGQRQMDSIASALELRETWKAELAESIQYLMFAHRLDYFWHRQYDVLFPHQRGQLRMLDWVAMTNSMAFAFMLGWTDQAIYEGHLTYAILNQGYQLELSYDKHHRRAHAFMLRLFAEWRKVGLSHKWPSWGCDVPVYNGIIERWNDPNPNVLAPWLRAACDRHTHESHHETEDEQYDFGDYRLTRTPLEILLVLRLRQLRGLENPSVHHPLMAAPFEKVPAFIPVLEHDELMVGTLKRAREDWPQFDKMTSFEAVTTLH
jgi:hypothetical protein